MPPRPSYTLPALLFASALSHASRSSAQVFTQGGDNQPFAATISPPPTERQRAEMQAQGGFAGPPFQLSASAGPALLAYERVSFSAAGIPRDSFAPWVPRNFSYTGAALGIRNPLAWTVDLVAQVFPVRPYLIGGALFVGLGGAGGDAMPSDMEAMRTAQNQSLRFYQAAAGPSIQISTGSTTLRASLFAGVRATSLAFQGLHEPSSCMATGCPPFGPSPYAWAIRPLLQARASVDLRAVRLGNSASLGLGLFVAGEVIDGPSVLFGLTVGVRVDPRRDLPSSPP